MASMSPPPCKEVDVILGSDEISVGPTNRFYDYVYTQTVYTQFPVDEIGLGGQNKTITSIAWNYTHTEPADAHFTIYMGNNSGWSFNDNKASSFVPFASLQQVYSGAVHFDSANEWTTVYLNTPFAYTGQALVVAVLKSGDRTAFWWKGYSSGSAVYTCRNMYYGQNYVPFSLSLDNMIVDTNRTSQRPNVQLGVCPEGYVPTSVTTPAQASPQPANIVGYYNIMGQRLPQEPQVGFYIIKYDNGTAKKVTRK